MPDIVLKGVVYRASFRSTKPLVFIDVDDHKRLNKWWLDNHVDTKLEALSHPISNKACLQISAESTAKNIKDGTPVDITIGVSKRHMKSGIIHVGIRTLSIEPTSA